MSQPAAAGGGPMTPVLYRVIDRVAESDDTVTLTLAPDGDPITAPGPGQFNMLWAFGAGEAPISLAGYRDGHLVHTVRRVGAVTTALWAARPGAVVGVRGPFGTGWDLDRARGNDVLVVAGGLGIAPVRPLIDELAADRDRFARVAVLLGARTPDGLLYQDELTDLAERAGIELRFTVDVAPVTWRGEVGLVTKLLAAANVDPTRAVAFVCGPEIMMQFVASAIADRGGEESDTFVSLERNMHCGIGHCGHCQLGPALLCKDGPVLDWATVEPILAVPAR